MSYRNHPLGHDPKQEHCTLELFLLVHTHPQDIQNGIDPSKVFVAVQLLEVFARRKLIETKISSAFSSDNQETENLLTCYVVQFAQHIHSPRELYRSALQWMISPCNRVLLDRG